MKTTYPTCSDNDAKCNMIWFQEHGHAIMFHGSFGICVGALTALSDRTDMHNLQSITIGTYPFKNSKRIDCHSHDTSTKQSRWSLKGHSWLCASTLTTHLNIRLALTRAYIRADFNSPIPT